MTPGRNFTADEDSGLEGESEGDEESADNPVLLSPFLPRMRTFFLLNLESNQTYEFHMMCVDLNGRHYATNAIIFTTGKKKPNNSKLIHWCVRKLAYKVQIGATPASATYVFN